jgi:hypothetical protein
MRRAQTIWRIAAVLALASAWLPLLAGCDSPRRPPHTRPAPLGLSASAAFEEAPTPAPSLLPPVAEALQEVHEQKLEILPPRDETPRLAFGKGRLAQAVNDQVVFRDTKDGAVVSQASVGAVRAVSGGIDGSLIALGSTEGAHLDPHSTKPRSFAHVAFFPGAALFADLEDPSHFYVYYGGEQQLFHYAFEAEAGAFLPIEDRFPLAGCVGAPALTHDGAFVCTTADGIERRAPRGRETRFKLPAGVADAVRLLPAKRLDEVFSVSQTGQIVHLRLQAGTVVLGRFQLPALPFAAASNSDALAFVLVSRPASGSARHWTLLVTDFDGQERYQTDLPSPPAPPDEDWLKAVIGDKNLAISEFEPLVAVGGAGAVGVWDYARGASVFQR